MSRSNPTSHITGPSTQRSFVIKGGMEPNRPFMYFRRVLGVEAVGLVEEADVGGFQSGHAVVSLAPRPIYQRSADLRCWQTRQKSIPGLTIRR